ncbi:MAG: hypothetical protein M3Y91_01380 [Actinomycetota bacterium]|nr:hypothetical protein [Actinomycetota bacterium]
MSNRPTPSEGPDGPSAPPPAAGRAPHVTRLLEAIDQRGDRPSKLASSVRMRGNEPTVGYVIGALQVIIPVAFLTVTTGRGAPPHPATVAPVIGLVLALCMAASIRLSNRILTAFLAVTSTLATTATAVPASVRALSTVDLLAGLGFAMWITLRQSKARNVVLAERRKANQAARSAGGRNVGGRNVGGRNVARSAGGRNARLDAGSRPASSRRGRKAAEAAEPAGPPPSARYTPPKKRP